MHLTFPKHIHKKRLAAALTVAMGCAGIGGSASADQITMTFSGLFTMLNPSGAPLVNTDRKNDGPYNGNRTPVTGILKYDTDTGGISTVDPILQPFINPFSFFGSGFAIATTVNMQAIGDGLGGAGSLLLANMGFNWGGNNGIPVSLVLDATGLRNAITAGVTTSSTISATGVLAASDHTNFGTSAIPAFLTMGVLPLASTTWNTTQIAIGLGTNPSGTVPLIADSANDTGSCSVLSGTSCGATQDVGIGGNPMNSGPFTDFNANFDFQVLHVVEYVDTTDPVITLTGGTQTLNVGDTYTELGATCADNHDAGSLSVTIDDSDVNTSLAGSYTVTYNCSDSATPPNAATQVTRTVDVVAAGFPSITLLGSTPVTHECGTTYTDAGATASDPEDGDITGSIVTVNGVNAAVPDPYTVTYNVTDSDTNAAPTVTRAVNVVDTIDPVITISGGNTVTMESTACAAFNASKPVATATDTCDASVTPGAPTGSAICTIPAGQDSTNSALSYSATDDSGNIASATLNITVNRSEPVISLVGNASIVLASGDTFTDPGVTVHDVQDGDATYDGSGAKIGAGTFGGTLTIGGSGAGLSGTTPANGTYTITYTTTDSDDNVATQVTRSVVVGANFSAQNSNFSMLNPLGQWVDGASDITATWGGAVYTSVAEADNPAANMLLATATPTPFSGYVWTAHDVRVYGPGTYQVETCPAPIHAETGLAGVASDDSTHCWANDSGTTKNTTLTVTVGAGQLGAHMLFDWGSVNPTKACGVTNCNIDVFVVWDQDGVFTGSLDSNTNLGAKGLTWDLASIDPDSDGIPGVKMIDGAFVGFNANFNLSQDAVVQPPPEPEPNESGGTKLGGGGATGLWTLAGLLGLLGLRRKRV